MIAETARLANIVPGIFRKALKEIHVNGNNIYDFVIIDQFNQSNNSFSCQLLLLTEFQILVNTGYTIPAGWGVMVCPPAVHLNPEIYEDPLNFNPWRWKVSNTHQT